jgi:hypothetical protein
MSEMTLFKGKGQMPVLPQDFIDPVTDAIAGGAGSSGGRRISIKGKAFRQIVGGKEVNISEDNTLDVVLINAAPVSRMYYAGAYKEGEVLPPTCWSSDTQSPDSSVPKENRQASRCNDCPMNIKGSGTGDTRACRFSQRVAVVLDGEIEEENIYQMQLPATSVFGNAEGNKMPLQAYGKFLKANNAHAIAVVTRMKFDIGATQPKLFFSAVRPLSQEELDVCLSLREHPDTMAAITLTVAETDGVKLPTSGTKKAAPVVDEDDDDEVEAPVKATKKAAVKKPVVLEDEDDEEEEEEVAPPPKKKKAPVVIEQEDEDDEEEEIAEPVKAVKKKTAEAPAGEPKSLDAMIDDWDD